MCVHVYVCACVCAQLVSCVQHFVILMDCSPPGSSVHGILQARLQQYVNQEIPDVQGEFSKGRETRDQVANICWIIEKAR